MTCLTPEQLEALACGALGSEAEALREHLDGCDACRARFEECRANEEALARLKRDSPSTIAAGLEVPPPAGDSFPGYELLREIHRGGQGVVYQALQKATKRKVAIKVMREGPFAGPRDKARFEREVQILGALKHPNIVTIHDSGTAAGQFYYVMDYISGLPLDQYMASRERSIEETLKLFAGICEAVNAAHLKGVIHRDLKPGNIRIDSNGEPHVLDFGLARVVTGGITEESRPQVMTLTGQFIGSLPWASPEQAEAMPDKIDIRTDVYSLGVILYQMLTGRFPYEVVGNMRDVLDRILKAEPARPSTVRKQINDEVETIALKCLQKERERRYQSAGELARDIGHYLAGEPIEAKRDFLGYVIWKHIRKHKRGVVVTILLAATGSVASLLAWSARERDRREQYLSLSLTARAHLQSGEYQEAEQLASQAAEVRATQLDQAYLASMRGWIAQETGRAETAEALARETLELLEKSGKPRASPASLADAYALLGRALSDRQDLLPAETALRKCLELRLKHMPGDWRTANVKSVLGGVLARQRRFAEAESLLIDGVQGMILPEPIRRRKREALERLVELYESWNLAEPNKGYDLKVTEWREKLAYAVALVQPLPEPATEVRGN